MLFLKINNWSYDNGFNIILVFYPKTTGFRSRIFSNGRGSLFESQKFTDNQIMDAVNRIEAGFGLPDICREMGISTATFYKWQAKYGGMDVSKMSRMKELGEENRRIKKMYLEAMLKAEIVSEALEKKW